MQGVAPLGFILARVLRTLSINWQGFLLLQGWHAVAQCHTDVCPTFVSAPQTQCSFDPICFVRLFTMYHTVWTLDPNHATNLKAEGRLRPCIEAICKTPPLKSADTQLANALCINQGSLLAAICCVWVILHTFPYICTASLISPLHGPVWHTNLHLDATMSFTLAQ